MADFVEMTGKTVDEAIEAALLALHLSKERCTIEIIEEPSKGFFGIIGKRAAKVRVTAKETPLPDKKAAATDHTLRDLSKPTAVHEDAITDREVSYSGEKSKVLDQQHDKKPPASSCRYTTLNLADVALSLKKAEDFLQQIFHVMDLDIVIEKKEQAHMYEFNLLGRNLGILIGKHGQTLDALQYLTNLAANQGLNKERIRIVLDIEGYRERREETLYRLAARLADRCWRTNQRIVLEPMNRHERKIIHLALQENQRVLTYSAGEEPFRKVVIEPKHRVYSIDSHMKEDY